MVVDGYRSFCESWNFPGTLGRRGAEGWLIKYRPYNLDKQQGQDVLFIKPIKHTNVSNVSIMQSPSYTLKGKWDGELSRFFTTEVLR